VNPTSERVLAEALKRAENYLARQNRELKSAEDDVKKYRERVQYAQAEVNELKAALNVRKG
jgi:predicted ribosome quality control (RQC) complex YloA/Tae2 family protein